MREIKFRVWDKLNNQMLEVMQICFEDRREPYMRTGITGFDGIKNFYLLKFEDCELMQFTGLFDKNKTEIFEGDICKNGDYVPDAHTSDYRIEEVNWDNDNACWQGWNFNEDGMSCEVIGNIYENPDLIT